MGPEGLVVIYVQVKDGKLLIIAGKQIMSQLSTPHSAPFFSNRQLAVPPGCLLKDVIDTLTCV